MLSLLELDNSRLSSAAVAASLARVPISTPPLRMPSS